MSVLFSIISLSVGRKFEVQFSVHARIQRGEGVAGGPTPLPEKITKI